MSDSSDIKTDDGAIDDIDSLLSMQVSKDYVNCVWTHEPTGKNRRKSMERSPAKLVIADLSESSDLENEKLHTIKTKTAMKSKANGVCSQPDGASGRVHKRKKNSKSKKANKSEKKASKTTGHKQECVRKITTSPSSLNSKKEDSDVSKPNADKGKSRKINKSLLVVSSYQKVNPADIKKSEEPVLASDDDLFTAYRKLVLQRSLPPYTPKHVDERFFNGKYYSCTACADKFIMETSLLTHMSRRTAEFSYKCTLCKKRFSFYNRCSVIVHIKSHGVSVDSIKKANVVVLPFKKEMNESNALFKHLSTNYSKCPECCKLVSSLEAHLQGLDEPDLKSTEPKVALDASLSCKECTFMLPTRCAFTAHMRYHESMAPHICPDCGVQFWKSSTLLKHMEENCFHIEKRSVFKCGYCKVVVMSVELFTEHLIEKHLRPVYVCHMCNISVGGFEDFNTHRTTKHGLSDVDPLSGTAALCARAECDKCPGVDLNLGSLKGHAISHTSDPKFMSTVYQCKICKTMLSSRELMISHKSACKGKKEVTCDTVAESNCSELSVNVVSSFQPEASPSKQVDLPPSESASVLETLPEAHSKISMCEDSSINDRQDFKTEVASNSTVLIKSTNTLDSISSKSGQPSGKTSVCKLCKEVVSVGVDKAALKKHFTSKHFSIFMKAVHDKGAAELLTQNVRSKSKVEVNIRNRKNLADFLKSLSGDMGSLNGSRDDSKGVFGKRKIKAGKIKSKSSPKSVGQNLQEVKGFHCYKCIFTSEDAEEFKTHIVTHKSNSSDLQCPMCGLCFIVRPPLEKHLIVQHALKDVEKYLADQGFECQISEDEAESVDVQKVETEELKENQCKVCRATFESAILLEKHFRVHGGAFLLASMKAKQLSK